MFCIIAEHASFLAYFPYGAFGVNIEPVQVHHGIHFFISIHQFVRLEVLSVVSVDAVVGKKPHVTFRSLLNCIYPSVAQTVFHTDVFVCLCNAYNWQ